MGNHRSDDARLLRLHLLDIQETQHVLVLCFLQAESELRRLAKTGKPEGLQGSNLHN